MSDPVPPQASLDPRKSAERRALAAAELRPRPFRRLFLRVFPNEDARFLALAALAGVAGGVLAEMLRVGIALFERLFFFGRAGGLLDIARTAPPWLLLAAPTAAGLAAGSITLAARRAPGAGVATIMEAVAIRYGFLSFAGTLLRAIASVLAIGGGGSVGREGPIIGLSSAAASGIGRLVALPEGRLRILVACGAAAGFAAAYNTPIAGTLFVLEVIVGVFAVEVLGPLALASVVGTLVTWAFIGGNRPLFDVPPFEMHSAYEALAFVLLGFAAAAAGALFLDILRGAESLFGKTRLASPLRTALGGAIVGAIALAGRPEVLGNGYDTVVTILGRARSPLEPPLVVIFVAKIVATSASVGSGVPGGVFTPTLLLGAALGGALGQGLERLDLIPQAEPGAYALVGMGAMLAATTRAPLLSVVFIFETSRDWAIMLPLLLSCAVASLVAGGLRPRSIYEEELERRGLSWEGTPEERALRAIRVRDVMRTNVPLLPPNVPVRDIVRTFFTTRIAALYIGDGKERLLGAIDFQDAKQALDKPELQGVAIAADLVRPVPSVSPEATIVEANEALFRTDVEQLPVVDAEGRFLGVLTRRDLLAAIDREVLRRNVLLAKVRYRADEGTVTDFFELPIGQRLEQVPLPESFAGKTLADLDIRTKWGLNVLAVVRPLPDGGSQRFAPNAQDRVLSGDVLVVIGSREAVEAFKAAR
jgi:CIC family chloride channel protein